MKRLIYILLFAITIFGYGKDSAKRAEMANFMGMDWNITAKEFKETFKYSGKLIPVGTSPNSQGKGFVIPSLDLNESLKITVSFGFQTQEGFEYLPFQEINYSAFKFTLATIIFELHQLDELRQFFIDKYGEPTIKRETSCIWENEELKRQIILDKHLGNGLVVFAPYDPKELEKHKNEEGKKAADKF
jgi:hypothetical protein